MNPRKRRLEESANGRILDASVRRAIAVQRAGDGVANRIVRFLDDEVFPDVVARLESRLDRIRSRGYDSGVWTTKRYKSLLYDLTEILGDGAKESRKLLNGELRTLAKAETLWAAAAPNDAARFDVRMKPLDLRVVQTIVEQPVRGRPQAQWWDSLAQDAQKRLHAAIGTGLAQGETVDQMVQRVRGTRAQGYSDGILQVTRRQAEAIVRTATNHVSTQTREQTYRANADVIKGVQWVATLDTRTTQICRSLDGKVFPLDDGPRPPAHWGCRSTTTPVLKSWKELGINAKEIPESTRASMDGQVAEAVTYREWEQQQPGRKSA